MSHKFWTSIYSRPRIGVAEDIASTPIVCTTNASWNGSKQGAMTPCWRGRRLTAHMLARPFSHTSRSARWVRLVTWRASSLENTKPQSEPASQSFFQPSFSGAERERLTRFAGVALETCTRILHAGDAFTDDYRSTKMRCARSPVAIARRTRSRRRAEYRRIFCTWMKAEPRACSKS